MIGSLQNEGLFENMFQLTAEGVLVLDKDATLLLANPACENLFGIDSDDLLGKNLEILIANKNREQLLKHILNSREKTTNKTLEVFGIKADETEVSLEIRISPVVIGDKNFFITFLRDTTNRTETLQELKKANNKLIESNHRFDTLINNTKGILYRCKNNKDYTVEFISEACLEITGYRVKDFKDKTISFGQLILEADRNNVWEHIQTAIKHREAYNCEYRLKHKDGSIKYVWEKGAAVYNNQKKVIALEGFITNITAQKETKTRLRNYEAKTKALLEAIPDIMFIQDFEGKYIDWYAQNPENLILPPEKFIGKNMKDILPARIYKIINESHQNVIANGTLQIAEYNIKIMGKVQHFEARVALMNERKLLTIIRNVTKESDKDLQLNVKNNALAAAINSITIADAQKPNTPIIYCNAAFERITGYKKEEVYGRNCNFLQNDERNQKEIIIMKNAIKKGEACNVVLRNYKKDGTPFWNDVTITPVRNNKNKLTHFIGIQNDVTKKVLSEDLKDRNQKILELITQDAPLKTIIKKIIDTAETHLKNCIGSILLLNKVDKTLNVLVAPNLPKTFNNFIDGTLIDSHTGPCAMASLLKKEVIVSNIETSVFSENYKSMALKNGLKTCWAFPIMSSTDKVLGTLNIYSLFERQPLANEKELVLYLTSLSSIAIEKHKNIIALKEGKKQLAIYAQKLKEKVKERTQEVMTTVQKLVQTNLQLEDQILITEHIENEVSINKSLTIEIAKYFPNGIIMVFNKDLQLVLAEGEALEPLSFKQLLFEGMTLDDVLVFYKEHKTRLKEAIYNTLSGKHLSFEIYYKNRFFLVNTTPLFDENNQIIYAVIVYNDISKQKEIEFSIQNNLKKLSELNGLKSRFISMASHEFRTPLSAIMTSAILIGKQNTPEKAAKREKYVLQIEKYVNHLTTILNDFLSLSKLEEGKTKAIKERFDIIEFSKKEISNFKVSLKKGQHICFKTLTESLFVNLDVKLLRQVIGNLLTNATKYSAEDTTIDFKIAHNEHMVLIQIKDNGIGIPKKDQEQLFNRFFRANNVTNIEGTGLGLNIAKYNTELMGGTIGFVSQLNAGATFWVKLPIDYK